MSAIAANTSAEPSSAPTVSPVTPLPEQSPPGALRLIDTHCHLDAPEFDRCRDRVVADALAAGVDQLVIPAIAADTFDAVAGLGRRYGCLIAFGLHPLYCDRHQDAHLAQLDRMLSQRTAVAVGEIGLDAWHGEDGLPRQEALLIEQLKLARRHDLPVLLHLRHAQDRVLKYLRRYPVAGGIAHAFNGSAQQAEEFIRLGFKLGFGGAMSFTGSRRIRRLAAALPLDALVLETDAPDIRPSWAQHQPNQPANVARFAEILAELRGLDLAEVTRRTRDNALAALGLTCPPAPMALQADCAENRR